tara:strand:- start:782 stop:1177 length:396 start_codon:yes stop_codon:yes gene_type:complete
MENNFKLEIISPEKIVFSDNVNSVTFPSYEGDMSVLKDHISIITFLRPGTIKVQKNDLSTEEFFVQDGTIEFLNNNLVILTASASNVKDLTREYIEDLSKNTSERLLDKNISDHDRYILNHKLDALKEVRN